MTAQKAEVDWEAWDPPHPLQPLTLKPCAGKITISVFGPKGGRFPLVWLVCMILPRALRDRTVGVAVGLAVAAAATATWFTPYCLITGCSEPGAFTPDMRSAEHT